MKLLFSSLILAAFFSAPFVIANQTFDSNIDAPITVSCDPKIVASAPVGFHCKTSKGDIWKIEAKTSRDKVVLRDTQSGILVIDQTDKGRVHWDSAKSDCNSFHDEVLNEVGNFKNIQWALPTGYSKSYAGKAHCEKVCEKDIEVPAYPKKDSDFITLEKHGIREVVNTSSDYYWSSSPMVNTRECKNGFGDFVVWVFQGVNAKLEVTFPYLSGIAVSSPRYSFFCVSR